MRDFASWSINLGRWRGTHFRLHASFLLFAIFVIYLGRQAPDSLVGHHGGLLLISLFFAVLAHELGHAWAAARYDGVVEQIVIGPLGGLAQPQVPHEPHYELVTALAGPAANLLVWLTIAPILLLAGENLTGLLNPLEPQDWAAEASTLVRTLKLTLWLNWFVMLVNLLPVFPFDGGRALRSVLWPAFGYRVSALAVSWGGKFAACGMCVAAWLAWKSEAETLVPPWALLSVGAIYLYFSARQQAALLDEPNSEEEPFGYDFSQGYTSLERSSEPQRNGPAGLRKWLLNRREAKRQRQQSIEQDEERHVDEILARLHELGLNGLTAEERALLQRVSARYRNRQQS